MKKYLNTIGGIVTVVLLLTSLYGYYTGSQKLAVGTAVPGMLLAVLYVGGWLINTIAVWLEPDCHDEEE